jgi:hypothetical protein
MPIHYPNAAVFHFHRGYRRGLFTSLGTLNVAGEVPALLGLELPVFIEFGQVEVIHVHVADLIDRLRTRHVEVGFNPTAYGRSFMVGPLVHFVCAVGLRQRLLVDVAPLQALGRAPPRA